MSARFMKGCWWIDMRWQHKRIRRKSPLNTKRGAEEYERRVRQQILDGTFDLREEEETPIEQPTFTAFAAEFLATYVRANNKPSEVHSKETILRLHLGPCFGTLKLADISVRHIERYKADKLNSGLGPKSINNTLTVLRRMLVLAVEWGLIKDVPKIKWLKAPKPEFDFLDFDEAERFIAGADPEWRAMITIALKTGLRLGELLALRWDDIDLKAGRLMVRRAVARGIVGTTKSGKAREVALSTEAIRALRSIRHLKGDLVFSNTHGDMLSKNVTKHPLWRACKRSGLRQIGWHTLRHTFASHLAMRGVPLIAVQQLLGHATIEMTMRYAHLAPAVHRQAVELLDRKGPAEFGHQMGTEGV